MREPLVNDLKILNVKACGLRMKLILDDFREECSKCDIIHFNETKTDDTDIEYLQTQFAKLGFKVFVKNRSKMSVVTSGGLITAVKTGLSNHVRERATSAKAGLWLEITFNNRELAKNLLIGNIYIPPRSSHYSNVDLFTEIEQDSLNLGTENQYLLFGDFNAYTGSGPYVIILNKKFQRTFETSCSERPCYRTYWRG